MVDAVREICAVKRAVAGAPDGSRLVKAPSISVMATAAIAPSLRTIGIMAPTTSVRFAGSDVPALPTTRTVNAANPRCYGPPRNQKGFIAPSPVGRCLTRPMMARRASTRP